MSCEVLGARRNCAEYPAVATAPAFAAIGPVANVRGSGGGGAPCQQLAHTRTGPPTTRRDAPHLHHRLATDLLPRAGRSRGGSSWGEVSAGSARPAPHARRGVRGRPSPANRRARGTTHRADRRGWARERRAARRRTTMVMRVLDGGRARVVAGFGWHDGCVAPPGSRAHPPTHPPRAPNRRARGGTPQIPRARFYPREPACVHMASLSWPTATRPRCTVTGWSLFGCNNLQKMRYQDRFQSRRRT